MTTINIETMTKVERSILLYAETCCVDYGGLLEGQRMNADDMAALKKFEEAGILEYGRIPFKLLGPLGSYGRKPTHWITFTDAAWEVAHALRRRCSHKASVSRQKVDEALADRAA